MNYLAHAYLSFRNPEWLVGNMISDYVKGKQKENYPEGIRDGIQLHRFIDTFTDNHPATQEAKLIFKPEYRLYSGAFVDIVYDHFLATDTNRFTDEGLKNFAEWVYETLDPYQHLFPEKFGRMFPYMRKQNWLYNYNVPYGMERSFEGLSRRALYIKETNTAYQLFISQYAVLKGCYEAFIDDVESNAKTFSAQFPTY